jgi:hypothetical protein
MAAGLGFKTFTTGEVLTAADTNGYLMQGINVFASTAARDAAITSPQEGQFAYTKDTNSLWYYTGSAWAASGATGDIEGVTAGIGISGGGTSGTVTVTNSMATAIDAKGDLIAGTAADTFDRLAVGTNGQTLVADSTASTGLKWATPSSGSTFAGVSVYDSTNQAISNGVTTALTFNLEYFDTNGYHSTSTNTSRLTVPAGKAGYYLITAQGTYAKNATGGRSIVFYKNGAWLRYSADIAGSSSFYVGNEMTVVYNLAEADYIELFTYQNSGGSLNFDKTDGGGQFHFSMEYLGA